ncbi:MAG: serine hydrolase [Cyclobacteriaceae bacterium]|nr:serine hydrolase [Cyclobacteriaceae bacterium]
MTLRIILMASVFPCFLSHCGQTSQDDLIERLLVRNKDSFQDILENPDLYGVQVIYTQIERDPDNRPSLRKFKYRVNPAEYFYPASTVKLPVALLSLERLNELDIPGLSKTSLMLTDSAYSGQSSVKQDTSLSPGKMNPSVAQYIKKIFLVSDNVAFNRLFEFLGPDYINNSLHGKGYTGSRIIHRLSLPLSLEENRYTNPVRFFYPENELVYQQGLIYAEQDFTPVQRILLGDGYICNDSLIREPMDFSRKNFIPLEELHDMLVSVIFPGNFDPGNLFDLTETDRKFILSCMSMYPGESQDPFYGEKYEDNYGKFLMFGDRNGKIPENIRIFNKIGLAYGFMVESAYIIDFDAGVEFFLSAMIHVNKNRIYNDGVYEYDTAGFPFMGKLGRMIHQYEKDRNRSHTPNLSDFMMNYTID